LQNYADKTGGIFVETDALGAGAGDAVREIVERCGAREILVPVDIRPTSCPNPFNLAARGVLPVAILGTMTGQRERDRSGQHPAES
jgi:hypothetical protein